VDHHLVALARSAGIDAVMQRRLREAAKRVRLLLRHGRRSRGNVLGLLRACPLVEVLSRRGERLNKHGADFGLHPSADHDHAVFILMHVKRAVPVPPHRLLRFCLAIHPAPAADDVLDVLGGAGPANGEESFFRPAVATRVSARTLEYDSSPRASACASCGSAPRARATRTRSRAAPRSSPTRHDNQCAHERKPVFQPSRSAISSPRRSSSTTGSGVGRELGVLMFIGESSVRRRRLYTPMFEAHRRRMRKLSPTSAA